MEYTDSQFEGNKSMTIFLAPAGIDISCSIGVQYAPTQQRKRQFLSRGIDTMTKPHESTSFATRLARFREARRLSQKQLAARIGCEPILISRYESGRQVPRTPEMYLQLSAALTVSPVELLGALPGNGAFEDPRLVVRVRELSGRLAPDQVPALLALLDAALALAEGEPEGELPAPDPGGAA
jgi:transcriptional regulator with XRE-family HTH domain